MDYNDAIKLSEKNYEIKFKSESEKIKRSRKRKNNKVLSILQ